MESGRRLINLMKRVIFLGEKIPISITVEDTIPTTDECEIKTGNIEIEGLLMSAELVDYDGYRTGQNINLFIKIKNLKELPEKCRDRISFTTLPSSREIIISLQELVECLIVVAGKSPEIHIYDDRVIYTLRFGILKEAVTKALLEGERLVWLKLWLKRHSDVIKYFLFLAGFGLFMLLMVALLKIIFDGSHSLPPVEYSSPPKSQLIPQPQKVLPPPVSNSNPQSQEVIPPVLPPEQPLKKGEKNDKDPMGTDRPTDIHD